MIVTVQSRCSGNRNSQCKGGGELGKIEFLVRHPKNQLETLVIGFTVIEISSSKQYNLLYITRRT